jgi:hypothetical protein
MLANLVSIICQAGSTRSVLRSVVTPSQTARIEMRGVQVILEQHLANHSFTLLAISPLTANYILYVTHCSNCSSMISVISQVDRSCDFHVDKGFNARPNLKRTVPHA